MKGLSCTGTAWPLGIPFTRGFSGVQGTTVLGMPLGIRPDFPMWLFPTVPLAVGVFSKKKIYFLIFINNNMGQWQIRVSMIKQNFSFKNQEKEEINHYLFALERWLRWVSQAQGFQMHRGSSSQSVAPSGCPEESSRSKRSIYLKARPLGLSQQQCLMWWVELTLMLDEWTSASRICSGFRLHSSLSCFFRPMYFSSMLRRSP